MENGLHVRSEHEPHGFGKSVSEETVERHGQPYSLNTNEPASSGSFAGRRRGVTVRQGSGDRADSGSAVANQPLIQLRKVTKTYHGRGSSTEALSPIDLDVVAGEFVSVLGPSGCGKSTLMMLVAGLLPVSGGSLSVNGQPVTKPLTDLGVVFQQDLLMEWRSALRNVLIQGEMRGIPEAQMRPKALELLDMVGLTGFTDAYPSELSGGMRQRVSICRALVHEPPLLLMDEPFGALDALTRDQMGLDLLRIWNRTRCTVLFITHSISEAIFMSDRVVVFSDRPGRIADDFRIELPRPRRMAMRETPEFTNYVQRVRSTLTELGVIREGDDDLDTPGPGEGVDLGDEPSGQRE
jgi:NitT/TauT family transport system ATP-binding protein